MAQIVLRDVSLSLGDLKLLDKVNLQVDSGEHIALIGRNGAGKSTLMKMILGQINPDEGEIEYQRDLRLSTLQQAVPAGDERSVYEVVLSGFGEAPKILLEFKHLTSEMNLTENQLARMSQLQEKIDQQHWWNLQQRVEMVLSKLDLPGESRFSELSGGLKRRVLLAQALVDDPDVLLLDEPTNHLDLEAIEWLQNFLITSHKTLIFTSHDRQFLKKVATRIVDLDRGKLAAWPGDYAIYVEKKEQALAIEERENALFDKKLAQEEVWVRQGIKARRTRNEGRVRALQALRKERSLRREVIGSAKLSGQASGQSMSGRLVIEAENLTYERNHQILFQDFSVNIMRGDKIGLIGPNGCGKTTLINLLLGKLPLQKGRLHLGAQLNVAYFDQLRTELNPAQSVMDNLAEGRTHVEVNGQVKHVMGYLQDFLFSPLQARSPVSSLSGGECNRLLLAKLFTKPANFLVLDEPTNDLDIETLELLESLLLDFSGTVLVVSHDRQFLNNVVGSILAFESNGSITEYVGGYDDYLIQRSAGAKHSERRSGDLKKIESAVEKKRTSTKLSYRDQRELDQLPEQIEALEAQLLLWQEKLADPDLYQKETDQIRQVTERAKELEAKLNQAYVRWAELDELLKQLSSPS